MSLTESSPLGSWHGHLFTLDRRQCLFFCHDASRYVLFLPGIRKEDLAGLDALFRPLFLASLAVVGVDPVQVNKAALALGPLRFDTATDRSVQGSIRVVKIDLEFMLGESSVMQLDPLAVSCKFNRRPATARGRWLWPEKEMRAAVARL